MIPPVVLQSFSPEIAQISEGQAIVLIGVLALLFAGAVLYRNPAAAVAWSLTTLTFVFSIMLGVAFELFYVGVLITTILLSMGIIVRWGR